MIDLNAYPVSKNLKALLKDKTTKKNIIFATSVYSSKGIPIKETEQMTEEILKGFTQYNKFMDEAYKIASCVELITPARQLWILRSQHMVLI